MGSAAACAWPLYTAVASSPFCRHPHGVRMARGRRFVRENCVDVVVFEPGPRRKAGPADRDCVDARLYWALFLAASSPVVFALRRVVFRERSFITCPGV